MQARRKDIVASLLILGRLERIGLSTPVPQTGVLPLNYSRHEQWIYTTRDTLFIVRILFLDAYAVSRYIKVKP